jgi:hypothetical protein
MKTDYELIKKVLFIVLLVYCFEYFLVFFSNISEGIFHYYNSKIYEYSSLFLIPLCSLLIIKWIYEKLNNAKYAIWILLFSIIILNCINVFLSFWLGQLLNKLNSKYFENHLLYLSWLTFIKYISKYILILLLFIASNMKYRKEKKENVLR